MSRHSEGLGGSPPGHQRGYPADPPFDAGLQVERTLLAWRRTALSVAVLSAAGVRLTAPVIGWPAVGLGVLGVASALGAYLVTGGRYRQVHRALRRDPTSFESGHPGNGWPQVALAVTMVLLALTGLAYLAAHAG